MIPSMVSPTLEELGIIGDTEAIEKIMAGNYVSSAGTDAYMQELLEEMRMPKAIRNSVQA